MKILGLYGAVGWYPTAASRWVHSSGAAYLVDGVLQAAIGEERLTGNKYTGVYPEKAIEYVLGDDQPDLVVLATCVHLATQESRTQAEEILQREFPEAQVMLCDHHQAHALLAYLSSPFEEAAIFTFDGVGSAWVEGNCFHSENALYALADGPENLGVVHHSKNGPCGEVGAFELGGYYNMASREIYRKKMPDSEMGNPYLFMETAPGKVMGLAAHGDASNIDQEYLVNTRSDPFYFPTIHVDMERIAVLVEAGDPADVTAFLQKDFEQGVTTYLASLPSWAQRPHLCLGGGCALNILANRAILADEETGVERLWAHPASNDSGLALGAALAGWAAQDLQSPLDANRLASAYTGKEYTPKQVRGAIKAQGLKAIHTNQADTLAAAAQALVEGQVIGLFQGGSEIGPRALGHRSILADPRLPGMKDRINKDIKHREEWRPYAPSILAEQADQWLDLMGMDVEDLPLMGHMMLGSYVLPDKRGQVPAITHIDGTTRPQVVTDTTDPYHQLITLFAQQTDVPMVLNTSFNDNGKPIVETPQQALEAFKGMALDGLVLGDYYLHKEDSP
jgi:carbamoyltransferase